MGLMEAGKKQERRQTSRFPMREDVMYKVLHSKRGSISGSGTTLNISSEGILFTTKEMLPVGRMVELSVNWPARLDGTCALKFVASGRVVRSADDQAVVRIERYQFKTRGSVPKVVARASEGTARGSFATLAVLVCWRTSRSTASPPGAARTGGAWSHAAFPSWRAVPA